jgi:hypothetical protein
MIASWWLKRATSPVTTTTPLQLKGRRGPKARGTTSRRVVTTHCSDREQSPLDFAGDARKFRIAPGRARGSRAFARDLAQRKLSLRVQQTRQSQSAG